MAMLMSVMSFASEINLDFTKINGLASWGSSYSKHVVEYDQATVTFTSANKQSQTITNQPVTKGQPVEVVMKNDITLSGVTFACTQWASKAQTITLHYSVDGGKTYTSTGITSSNFNISSNALPAGTNAVKITFSSTSNQIGIASCTLVTVDANPDAPKHTITATVNDEKMGSVTGTGEFAEGTTISLTAIANPRYEFVQWSNGSTENPLKVTVTEDATYTATFQAQTPITCSQIKDLAIGDAFVLGEFTVTYVNGSYTYIKDATGASVIYSSNYGLKAGDVVTGLAGTRANYNGLVQITPSVTKAQLTITAGTAPQPEVATANPTQADMNKYVKYEQVTFDATSFSSKKINATLVGQTTKFAVYDQWSSNKTFVKGGTYEFIGAVSYFNAVQVNFISATKLSLTISATATGGKVTGTGEYMEGDEATLIATANEGYEFVNWTWGPEEMCKTAEYTFTVEEDMNLIANFKKLPYNVTVTAENGTVTGAGEYEEGKEATLTATANEGYEFTCWTSGEDTVSTANPYTFAVTANLALVANFKEVVVEEPVEAKLYLTPNANWKQSNARFAAYFFDNGETWVGMTKVAGETDLYEVTIPTDKKYPKVIFCRMNPGAAANNWNNKWNQTADLVIPTDGKNHYTVKDGTWDNGGGTWSIWPVPTVKTYVDITITVTANAPASIKWANAGDKLADATEYVAMTAGENNTYTYTLAQVDELKGVDYTVKVGEAVSATQNTSKNVTADFKALLPQVAVQGVNNWDGTDKMTIADDYLTASITLPLVAKKYDLKLTVDATWKGTTSNKITRENNSSAFTGDSGNGSITADIAGDYVFTYTYATQTLTVTYPALTVKYNVTVTAENGTVEGAGEYEENAEATLTATAAEGYEFVNWTVGDSIVSTENPYKFTVTADLALVANFKEVVKAIEVNVTDATATSGEWSIDLAGSWNDQALTIKLWQDNTQGFGSYAPNTETGYYILLGAKELTPTTAGVYADNGDGTFTFTCSATDGTTQYNITVTGTSGAQEVYYEPFELTNLAVTDNETFLVLEASDMNMGLEVMLGVNMDGTLMDASQILFGGEVLPILSSEPVTVTFNEELQTDVYTARVVVEHMGGPLGLELIMYAGGATSEPIAVNIMGATAAVDEATDVLKITGDWDGIAFELRINAYDPAQTLYDAPQIAEFETEEVYATSSLVTVIKTGENIDVIGEFMSPMGDIYNVYVNAIFAAGPETGVDNINTTVAPVKVIENGQIFIISNGVKYNAQGAKL